jgi:ClpP class serine protease
MDGIQKLAQEALRKQQEMAQLQVEQAAQRHQEQMEALAQTQQSAAESLQGLLQAINKLAEEQAQARAQAEAERDQEKRLRREMSRAALVLIHASKEADLENSQGKKAGKERVDKILQAARDFAEAMPESARDPEVAEARRQLEELERQRNEAAKLVEMMGG